MRRLGEMIQELIGRLRPGGGSAWPERIEVP
jgi:hypothetical protein